MAQLRRWRSNERGGYRYLPGIEPYSCGVVAAPGNEIVHVTLEQSLPWRDGLACVRHFLLGRQQREQNLCGVELRCPRPHPMDGFLSLNDDYRAILEEWDMLVDGENPVARTNVAPVVDPPAETMLHGFSYCEPSDCRRQTYVVAGGGELPEGELQDRRIVRRGETSEDALLEKASCVVELMAARLHGLEVDQQLLSTIDVYTAHPLKMLLERVVLPNLPAAAKCGVRWYYSRPPVEQIEFEMDMRGVIRDQVLALAPPNS